MPELKSLLEISENLVKPLRVKAPEAALLTKAVSKISGDVRSINVEDIGALQKRVEKIILEEGAASLSRKDLRESCRTYLSPPHAPARTPKLAADILQQVEQLQRRSAFFALIDAYLDGFSEDDPVVIKLAERLEQLNKNWPWRPLDPWPARIQNYNLLTPHLAPQAIAKTIIEYGQPHGAVFESAGLNTDGRRVGALAAASFVAGCDLLRKHKGSASIPYQLRLIDWSNEHGRLPYPTAWPEFARALFEPWISAEPGSIHRNRIVDRAISHGGDPRINHHAWKPVEEISKEAYHTVIRWLTQASVRQFFDIVSETMTDGKEMWEKRRKFWTSYLDAEMISKAWVAFGADGALRAQNAARRTNDMSLSMFGRLESGQGRSPQHAALIMAIGDLIVVDWSHNGKYNIWPKNAPNRPALFKRGSRYGDYAPYDLMHAPINGPHIGNWQEKVAQIIRSETGLRP